MIKKYTLSDALVTKVFPHWSHLWSSTDRPRCAISVLMIASLLLLLSLLTKILAILSSPLFSTFVTSVFDVSFLSSASIVSQSLLIGCDNSGFVGVCGTTCVGYPPPFPAFVITLSLLEDNDCVGVLPTFWKRGCSLLLVAFTGVAIWSEGANEIGDR